MVYTSTHTHLIWMVVPTRMLHPLTVSGMLIFLYILFYFIRSRRKLCAQAMLQCLGRLIEPVIDY